MNAAASGNSTSTHTSTYMSLGESFIPLPITFRCFKCDSRL